MTDSNVHRSQAILKMPVDYVDATMILQDGESSEVILLLPPREDAAQVMTQGDAFLQIMRNAKICLVARDAIAALGLAPRAPTPLEEEMPHSKQRVAVRLRSGVTLDGTMSWTLVDGEQRLAEVLKGSTPYIELRTPEKSWFIAKAHLAYVEEA